MPTIPDRSINLLQWYSITIPSLSLYSIFIQLYSTILYFRSTLFRRRRENERANVAWNLGAMSARDEKCPRPRSDTPERPTEKASNIDSINASMLACNNICEHRGVFLQRISEGNKDLWYVNLVGFFANIERRYAILIGKLNLIIDTRW